MLAATAATAACRCLTPRKMFAIYFCYLLLSHPVKAGSDMLQRYLKQRGAGNFRSRPEPIVRGFRSPVPASNVLQIKPTEPTDESKMRPNWLRIFETDGEKNFRFETFNQRTAVGLQPQMALWYVRGQPQCRNLEGNSEIQYYWYRHHGATTMSEFRGK
jgi:hypothetical protein